MDKLSTADAKYVKKMTAHHKGALVIAKEYLAAPAENRRPNLTKMARTVISGQTKEMAKMKAASGKSGM